MLFPLAPQPKLALAKALNQMTEALKILDDMGAPGEIGSTLDLAIARLQTLLARDDLAMAGLEALSAQLEYECSWGGEGGGQQPDRREVPPV